MPRSLRVLITYLLLILLALFMMGPFLWLLSVSLMPGRNVFANPCGHSAHLHCVR